MSSDNLDSGCSTCGSEKSLNCCENKNLTNKKSGKFCNSGLNNNNICNRPNNKCGAGLKNNENLTNSSNPAVKFDLSPPLTEKSIDNSHNSHQQNGAHAKIRLNSDTDVFLEQSSFKKSPTKDRMGLEFSQISPKHFCLDHRLNGRGGGTGSGLTNQNGKQTLASSSSESRSSSQESFAKFCSQSSQSQRNSLSGSGNDQPKSPGGSSTTSASAEFAFLAQQNCCQKNRRGTSSSNNSTLNAAQRFFRLPVVKQYFFRKKKSWPTLNVTGQGEDKDEGGLGGPDDLAVTGLDGGPDHVISINNSTRIHNITSSTAVTGESSAQNCQNFFSDLARGPSQRRKIIGRLPSKEDPGPSRDLLDPLLLNNSEIFLDTSNNGPNSAQNQQNSITHQIFQTLNNSGCCPVTTQNLKNLACFSNSLLFNYSLPPNGAKFKFVHEGQIQVCRLNHSRTVLGKLSSSKLLRRWENHFLTLGDDEISSKTPVGFMEQPLKYVMMEDVHALPQWDSCADKFCIRIFVPEGSILLQTNHAYTRNQWLYSIQWRRNLYRYRRMIELSSGRPEVLLKETKCLVEQVKCCPLQGDNLSLKSVVLITRLIEQIFAGSLPKTMIDPIITCIAPLLDTVCTVTEVSPFLSKYCNDYPRSRLIGEVLSDVAQQTLKKTMDFSKYPAARIFVQDFLLAINSQNNGVERIKNFVNNVHGFTSSCPHPRVLPNFVAVCLAAVHALFDSQICINNNEKCTKLECFCSVFEILSEFEDWRMPLSSLLQPVPFPEDVLANPTFACCFGRVLKRLGQDHRCEIHLPLLGVREGKEGWFHLVCPGGPVCSDDGELFSSMLKTLLHCCCRRKKFLQGLNGMLGPLQLLALRENEPCMEALCHMLEFEVVEGEDLKLQMITALQSTSAGKKHYAALCDRQIALRELQQKGGPRKLTLPSKSTDSDLAVLLSSGSFGNLEWLSLAFTNVTSACADYLIKLPSLRYLNLWSTQFGDTGLQLLSEHLSKLQVLNLCETPMTDKGLLSLSALKNLRKLNLNSTQLSAKTFLILKTQLPALQEVDVRYTDAWCADDLVS